MLPAPSTVIELVLAAWTAGTIALAAATRISGEVDAGHFKVVWAVGAVLAGMWGIAYRPALAVAGACAVTFATVYAHRDREAGLVAAALALAALGRGTSQPVFAAAAALLLGAVTNAMLLGHWHLNQPRLGTGPLLRLVIALWAGIATYMAASAALVASAVGDAADQSVTGGATAVAFTAFAAVLAGMVTHLVRRRSIMSATGILYLQVLLCFVAVFTGSLGVLARG